MAHAWLQTVVNFKAQWCGPCKMVAPAFEAMAKKYPGVNFLSIDVDEVQVRGYLMESGRLCATGRGSPLSSQGNSDVSTF